MDLTVSPAGSSHEASSEDVSAAAAMAASATPFTTAAAMQLIVRRIASLEAIQQFHRHHCWMQTVQMTRKDILSSFSNDAARAAFTADCLYLGLGAGKVVQTAPRGVALLNACRQLVREFAFHKSSSPIQAAKLLGARTCPYQFLPEGETHHEDSRSIALHKHHGTGDIVYKYLSCPDLAFDPDHLLTLQSTCSTLLQMYRALQRLVSSTRDFGINERDKLGKIDAGILAHFVKPIQKRLTLKAQQILETEIGLLAQAD
eukprot:INCI15164.1.p1 GENE.INCI15164.1~~INCI15164.1.p1  ORF type:complete len:259 (-),score=56.63 INCI15164.1:334-1110(-)